MKQLKLILVIFISTLLFAFTSIEVEDSLDPLNSLFKIERSKDNNQIFYDVNLDNSGELNNENPISVYWRRNTEGGIIKPLTWIQKKYAYGLKFVNVKDEQATFRFVSYKKMFFKLLRKEDNQFEVYTNYNDKLLKMDRIFIQLDGGTFWFPNITAIEIYAKDMKTGEDVIEIITP